MRTFLITSIFFLGIVILSAQESKSIDSEKKENAGKEQTKIEVPMEQKLELARNSIRNSGFIEDLYKYVALRKGNTNLCRESGCRESAEELLDVRYWAEGRCDQVASAKKKELCPYLVNGECDQLSGWKKDLCLGLTKGDVKLIEQAYGNYDFQKGGSQGGGDKDEIREMLRVYKGFQNYSPVVCERYLKDKDKLSKQLSCQIMFAASPENEIEKIVEDLAYFNLSRTEKNLDLCNSVTDTEIKDACKNSSVQKLQDIW